jgi:hypothetical protein
MTGDRRPATGDRRPPRRVFPLPHLRSAPTPRSRAAAGRLPMHARAPVRRPRTARRAPRLARRANDRSLRRPTARFAMARSRRTPGPTPSDVGRGRRPATARWHTSAAADPTTSARDISVNARRSPATARDASPFDSHRGCRAFALTTMSAGGDSLRVHQAGGINGEVGGSSSRRPYRGDRVAVGGSVVDSRFTRSPMPWSGLRRM